MLSLLGFCVLLQVDADAVRRLGDDDHAIRVRATQELKQLPYARSGELRSCIPGEADLERRWRLQEVVRHLAGKEAAALLAEGELYKALLKTAEAEGATDLAEGVSEKSAAAQETLQEIWDQLDSPGCKIVFPDSHRALVRSHGLYMIRPLLGWVEGPYSYAAVYYLTHWIEKIDLVPILRVQLQGEEDRRFHAYCYMLGHFRGPAAIETLRSVKNDRRRSADLRDTALHVLQGLHVYLEGCDPGILRHLAEDLQDEDPALRERAVEALMEHPAGIAEDLREIAMDEPDPARRQRIEAIIGHLESK